jgi:hypothetical protein
MSATSMTVETTCAAEALLREWSALRRLIYSGSEEFLHDGPKVERFKKIQNDEISQVVPRSTVGAAFQLLIACTAWPFRPSDPCDLWEDCSQTAADSLTDGNDYKTRLILAAYMHLTRDVADVDLRDAEIYLTAEHIDGGGIMQWMKNSGFDIDLRRVR